MRRTVGMALAAIAGLTCIAAAQAPYRWNLPRGVAPPPVPCRQSDV